MSATYTVNDPIPSTRFSIPDSYSLSLTLAENHYLNSTEALATISQVLIDGAANDGTTFLRGALVVLPHAYKPPQRDGCWEYQEGRLIGKNEKKKK